MVELKPGHSAVGLGVAEMVGFGFTTTATVAFLLQPALLPITVYTVLEDGVTVVTAEVAPPGDQM